MIELVGGASDFTHVTRLLQARSSHDGRQTVNFTLGERQELLVRPGLTRSYMYYTQDSVIRGLNVCTPVCARFFASTSVNRTIHLSGTFYYSLGQRCPNNQGSSVMLK